VRSLGIRVRAVLTIRRRLSVGRLLPFYIQATRERSTESIIGHGERGQRPGTMMWASLVPAAMTHAPPCDRLSGRPVDSPVA
jgi:hypothetical protein